ncbi:hypothetical protein [Massilia antarctica]|uniref:hypothetical protein n=1 Tax=Massilia antarctica TaxID=2765360 RepID=UPI0006BB91AD|nr:hypothetical protein [Massilia sp. H27-R4]MCY0915131.1 hypothetical protein [Massilia sp. H27-R4]CUI07111.1 hypothetical protein BN2497_8999 [Janthinobacterium sp. CG23_2]CUU30897.1 hypothetical protein BN3177_8999 [Janthinobacterium sp. CG23_2]
MKKPTPSSFLRLWFAAALIAAGTACSEPSNTPAAATPAKPAPAKPVAASAPAASLGARITAEIGDLACDDASQCHTLPVGSKACGGPAGFLPWSAKRSNGDLLAKLAAEQAAQERKQNEKSGMMSTCSVELDPGATCSAGKCVLQKPGLGGVQAR